MAEFKKLDDGLMVSGQIDENDIATAAELGVKVIVNNRPDHEEPGQPTSEMIKGWAESKGLKYAYIPVVPGQMPVENIVQFGEIFHSGDGDILAFCRSGMRSSALWAFSQAATSDRSAKEILDKTYSIGYDLYVIEMGLNSIRKEMQSN